MFNLSGSELVFLLLLALIVLGPEKLPDAIRRVGRTYAELKKMSTGFQSELKSALDEPIREMRSTADALRKAAHFDGLDELVDDATATARLAAGEQVPTAQPPTRPTTQPPADQPPVGDGEGAPPA